MEDAIIKLAEQVADREPPQPPPTDDVDADVTDESLLNRIKKGEGPTPAKWDTET
ncbi:MAG: hypothetical protein JWR34_3912 [Mycobacterium sp.]|nr:hypothetical protein [Mycobacterium sp.]